jgi:predicted anti-sigma-YlaC factor YlaD
MMKAHLNDTLINELADADPEAELDETVSEHLSLCAACREELSLARMVNSALDAVPRMEAPPELLHNVMTGVVAKRRSSQKATLAWAAMAAMTAMTLVILWLIAGGAASLTIEAIEAVRSLDLVTRIASSIWRTIPMELFFLCTALLLASSAVLKRLLSHVERRAKVEAEAG